MKHTQTKFSLSHAITTIAISVAEKGCNKAEVPVLV